MPILTQHKIGQVNAVERLDEFQSQLMSKGRRVDGDRGALRSYNGGPGR